MVALGALKYNDLKENRTSDIIFNWEKMLVFRRSVRICNIRTHD